MQSRFVGAWEIEQWFGISRPRLRRLISRPDWPAPYQVLAMGEVWLREEVGEWAARHRSEISDDDGDDDKPEGTMPVR
jgi:predicted DNA-binding transcriptional regulator AlpA